MPTEADELNRMAILTIRDLIVSLKGDRVLYSFGGVEVISDYAKGATTVLDSRTKRVATVPLAEFAAAIMAAEQTSDMEEGAKIRVMSENMAGQSAILGIPTKETVLIISGTAPDVPAPGLRMEFHFWLANDQELKKTPARRELAIHLERNKGRNVDLLTRMIGGFLGHKIGGPLSRTITTAATAMQFRLLVYMPGKSTFEPTFELGQELTEMVTEPIADVVFAVPPDYEKVSLKEILAETALTLQ